MLVEIVSARCEERRPHHLRGEGRPLTMSPRRSHQSGRLGVLALLCLLASLSAGILCVGFVSAGEWAPGVLVGSFALLAGALAMASARRARVEQPAQPVRFVPHAHLMAMLALAALAILAALLLPMLRR